MSPDPDASRPSSSTSDTGRMPERMTQAELAAFWQVSPRTLERWRALGTGPAWMRIGGRVLYRRTDVLAFEQAHTTGQPQARRALGAQVPQAQHHAPAGARGLRGGEHEG